MYLESGDIIWVFLAVSLPISAQIAYTYIAKGGGRMTGFADSVAGVIRRVSGDRKMAGSEATTVDSGNQDGGGGKRTDPKQSGENQVTGEVQTKGESQAACLVCKKDWKNLKKQGVPFLECSFCTEWFCMSCTSITRKNDISAISRPDVFWACDHCLSAAQRMIQGIRTQDNKHCPVAGNPDTTQMDIDNKIVNAVRDIVPSVVRECIEQLNIKDVKTAKDDVQKVTKLLSQTLLSDEEYPEIDRNITSHKMAKRIVNQQTQQNKPEPEPVHISQVVKQAFQDQRNEENDREERKKNIILYNVPERTEGTHTERQQKEKEFVEELLATIGTTTEPKEVARLGRYKKPEEGQEVKNRPIRVVLDSHEIQEEIMKNTPRLKDAQDPFKSVYLAYDMSIEERQTQREMVSIAKDKTANDPNFDYKIRGPPWKMIEVKYKKRKQKQPTQQETTEAPTPVETPVEEKTDW